MEAAILEARLEVSNSPGAAVGWLLGTQAPKAACAVRILIQAVIVSLISAFLMYSLRTLNGETPSPIKDYIAFPLVMNLVWFWVMFWFKAGKL